MYNWDFLIDDAAIAAVLPEAYAQYRRPIQGALSVFLGGLPEAHQAAILSDQAALPLTAAPSERLARLARSCPALHKLGQILARDRRLSPELRQHLQELESLPPSLSLETIQEILAREFGALDRLGITLEPPALAEASVAVVIPFRSDAPRADGASQGVFKVLKPGIEDRLEQELELLGRVGSYLDQRCEEFRLPRLDYRETFEQVRDKLRLEVRLDLEQQHLAHARTIYQGEPRVQIPALFEPCTHRVTAMERVMGDKVTAHGLASEGARRELAGLVTTALIAQPLFSRASPALFHGDPHAGNLFLTTDHRLAILDWSLAGSLGEHERQVVVQIPLAALALDAERVTGLVAELADGSRLDRPALQEAVRGRLRQIRQGQFPGFAWLMGLLDDAVQGARLRVGADLLLFRKTLHTLDGVITDIGTGDHRADQVLLGEFLRHFVAEWPGRWLARPDSRAFATRLSNADLARWLLSLPWTAPRFWLDQTSDILLGQPT